MSLIGIRKLNKKDNDYWQIKWKRQKFLDMFWERMYAEGNMSWQEIFDYVNSGDFTKDVTRDVFNIIQADMMENNNNL